MNIYRLSREAVYGTKYCGERLKNGGTSVIRAQLAGNKVEISLLARAGANIKQLELFDWGNDSAGTSRLAAALMLDALDEDKDMETMARYFHTFMATFLVNLPDRWELRADIIRSWMDAQESIEALNEMYAKGGPDVRD